MTSSHGHSGHDDKAEAGEGRPAVAAGLTGSFMPAEVERAVDRADAARHEDEDHDHGPTAGDASAALPRPA